MITNYHATAGQSNGATLGRRLWYWTFGGVIECAKIAFDMRHLAASEFTTSGTLLLTGLWILIPKAGSDNMAFTRVIGAVMPMWTFALLYIGVARVMMHCTLKGSDNARAWGLFFTTGAWGSMLAFNLLSSSLAFGTLFLMFMVLFTISLQARIEVKLHADSEAKKRHRKKD